MLKRQPLHCLGSRVSKSLKPGLGPLVFQKLAFPDDSDTQYSLRVVGWKMHECTFGLEHRRGRKPFLLPPAAAIQASSPFGVTRVGQDLATKPPPPPFPRRPHSHLCASGPAAPLPAGLSHLVTWRIFSYLLRFCAGLPSSVLCHGLCGART